MSIDESGGRLRERREPLVLRAIDRLSALAAIGAGLALVALILNVAVDVLVRAAGGRPIGQTLALTTYWWMPLLVTLSYAITEREREHITVTMLLDRLSRKTRRYVEGAFSAVGAALVLALAWYTSADAVDAAQIRLAANSVPPLEYWQTKILAAIGLSLLALQLIATTVRHLLVNNAPEPGLVAEGDSL